jgi:hypothetical protein
VSWPSPKQCPELGLRQYTSLCDCAAPQVSVKISDLFPEEGNQQPPPVKGMSGPQLPSRSTAAAAGSAITADAAAGSATLIDGIGAVGSATATQPWQSGATAASAAAASHRCSFGAAAYALMQANTHVGDADGLQASPCRQVTSEAVGGRRRLLSRWAGATHSAWPVAATSATTAPATAQAAGVDSPVTMHVAVCPDAAAVTAAIKQHVSKLSQRGARARSIPTVLHFVVAGQHSIAPSTASPSRADAATAALAATATATKTAATMLAGPGAAAHLATAAVHMFRRLAAATASSASPADLGVWYRDVASNADRSALDELLRSSRDAGSGFESAGPGSRAGVLASPALSRTQRTVTLSELSGGRGLLQFGPAASFLQQLMQGHGKAGRSWGRKLLEVGPAAAAEGEVVKAPAGADNASAHTPPQEQKPASSVTSTAPAGDAGAAGLKATGQGEPTVTPAAVEPKVTAAQGSAEEPKTTPASASREQEGASGSSVGSGRDSSGRDREKAGRDSSDSERTAIEALGASSVISKRRSVTIAQLGFGPG